MTEHLTSSQLHALNQLRDLTNGADDQVAIGVLETVNWDVERAADMIFGSGSTNSTIPKPKSRPPIPELQIDDSAQRTVQPANNTTNLLGSLLTWPLHILGSVFRFVFSVLRIRVPHIPFLSFNFHSWWYLGRRPAARSGPRDRHHWVTELEEETGAVCIGRSRASVVASGLDASGAGPSTLTSRLGAVEDDPNQKYLPDFTFGTYEETLKIAQKECRVACIVLVSEEHDDTAEFKRNTLTNPALLAILNGDPSNEHSTFIVWGGDVCSDPEAYSAAEKLGITTFPSVAFVAMQTVRGMRAQGSQQQTVMTVLSRHQGLASVRSETLVEHLNTSLVPRVIPYLTSLAGTQRQAEQERVSRQNRFEHERMLRQQQDRAFEDSARRDRDRILRKMEEESRAQEEKRREEELRQQELEREARRVEEQRQWEEQHVQWRLWVQKSLLGDRDPEGKGELRVAIRLANGTRLVHKFDREDTLSTLYAVVDQSLLSSSLEAMSCSEDVESKITSLVESHDGFWGFQLFNAYPRTAIPWQGNVKLGDVDGLTKGGQLIVEILDKNESRTAKSEDGYDTEEE